MAKITFYIEAESPSDFSVALRELIAGAGAPVPTVATTVSVEVTKAPEPAKPARNKKATEPEPVAAPALTAEPVAETQAATPAPAADPAPVAKETPAKITIPDLRKVMQALKAPVAFQLVVDFSGKAAEDKPKLTDIPEGKYLGLLDAARTLLSQPENLKQGAHE